MSITQTHILEAQQVALEADIPVLLWGPPGSGKTSAVNHLATEMDWPIETVMASLREPSDFAGLPVRTEVGVVLDPPSWGKRVAAHPQRTLVFFDEVNTAPPATQAALLRVVLDKVCGDLYLGANVRFVAAANEASQAAGGWDLAAPLANRFCHLDWVVDARTVATGLVGSWPTPAPLSIRSEWAERIPHYGSLVGAFLQVRPDLVEKVPDSEVVASKGWPSPRSWDRVARVLAVCDGSGISETARMLVVAGLVGDGAAAEYLNYERELDLPDPETLLANPERLALPTRLDQQYAVLMSVAAAVVANSSAKRWEAAMKVFVHALRGGAPDVASSAVMVIAKNRPAGAKLPKEFSDFVPVLVQAGLMAERSE